MRREQAEKMIDTLREVVSAWKRIEKLEAITPDNIFGKSHNQKVKARLDADYLHRYIEQKGHELHYLAVEAGIASLDEERYGTVIEKPDGWHEYKFERRRPRV